MSLKCSKIFFVSLLFVLVFSPLFVQSANAQVVSPGPCTNTIPSSAPNLYQVTTMGSGSATLYFAPPSSGFDGFTISYGQDVNADAYNATLSQGPTTGAVTYTVNALSPDTKYYFKVRANNGCAPGPWSNVLASNSSGSASGNTTGQTPPVTGPTDVLYFGIAALLLSLFGLGMFIKNK